MSTCTSGPSSRTHAVFATGPWAFLCRLPLCVLGSYFLICCSLSWPLSRAPSGVCGYPERTWGPQSRSLMSLDCPLCGMAEMHFGAPGFTPEPWPCIRLALSLVLDLPVGCQPQVSATPWLAAPVAWHPSDLEGETPSPTQEKAAPTSSSRRLRATNALPIPALPPGVLSPPCRARSSPTAPRPRRPPPRRTPPPPRCCRFGGVWPPSWPFAAGPGARARSSG